MRREVPLPGRGCLRVRSPRVANLHASTPPLHRSTHPLTSETASGWTKPPSKPSLRVFIFHKKGIFYSVISGLAFIGASLGFTLWLSKQVLTCPGWAVDCAVHPSVAWTRRHLSIVQGIVSTVHGIGLALLAYPAFILAECAVWPLVTHRAHSLQSLEEYLAATRGSVP